jgi:hypothetical protein
VCSPPTFRPQSPSGINQQPAPDRSFRASRFFDVRLRKRLRKFSVCRWAVPYQAAACTAPASRLLIQPQRRGRAWAGILSSAVALGADEFQFSRGQGPLNRPLGFSHRLSFGGGLASEKDPLKGERPFPKLTFDALNDGVFDVAMFQLQSSSRSRRTASLSGFFGFSHLLHETPFKNAERRSVPSSTTAKAKKGTGLYKPIDLRYYFCSIRL